MYEPTQRHETKHDRSQTLWARTLIPLPLGSVLPGGWLRQQLQIQADGLSGHLDEFWPSVARSRWIGGDAEGWERGPYWLDGIIPLAFLLDDERLKAKARFWVDTILARQYEDGWFGDKEDVHAGEGETVLDPWPQFVLFKALAQWHEATEDPRILPAMTRAMSQIGTLLDEKPLESWARMRWPDLVVSIHWLIERTSDVAIRDSLLALAHIAEQQGYDWSGHFADFRYTDWQPTWLQENHVVNHAMALKEAAVRFRQIRGNEEMPDPAAAAVQNQYAEIARSQIAVLDRFHGQATGVFTGDESLAGLSPSQGTELCAVVEYLYSLEHLLAAFGDTDERGFADLWERIAYNALPATFTPDMWAHQYVQQANQVVCKLSEERVYTNNGPDANLFGLEPNFGCCTANMHQGWPKFAAHLWMTDPAGNGLTALGYAPCTVRHSVHGVPIQVTVETNYPFEAAVRIAVRVGRENEGETIGPTVRFPLRLRIPGWTNGAHLDIAGGETLALPFGERVEIERDWTGETTLTLTLPMQVRVIDRPNNTVAIERGPLLYALAVDEEWKQMKGELPHADWEVYPVSRWNYALEVNRERPETSFTLMTEPMAGRASDNPPETGPFAPHSTPLRLGGQGRSVPTWTLHKNAAAVPPTNASEYGPKEAVTLVPYGCTHLRVTEFPCLDTEN